VKFGLNSEAVALSGLLERFWELSTEVVPLLGCCSEGKVEELFVPKTNGFAKGFKEADLRPAERDDAISVGRDG
jgi:hypothetical protein